MSRTDIPPAILAWSLRRMAGDGSIEWVMEPMQASVLLDVADMLDDNVKLRDGAAKMQQWYEDELRAALDENAKLRELVRDMYKAFVHGNCYRWCEFKEPCNYISDGRCQWYDRMRELGVEVDE